MTGKGFRVLLVALASCALTLTSGAVSEPEWIFVGHYELTPPAESGEGTEVTLVFRISNRNDADAPAATLVLEGSQPMADLATLASPVDIPAQGAVCLSRTLSLPRDEYERWQRGLAPLLRLEFRDAEGRAVKAPVVMLPMFDDEGGQPCEG